MTARAPLLSPELKAAMKDLRLGQLLPTLPERIVLAEKDSLPLQDFLLGIFTDEVQRRRGAAAARRADQAGLDPDMVFERWDKSSKVSFDRRVLQELSSLRFVEAQRNVVILGPVGVGKTFVASALGHIARRSGFNVRFTRADALLRLLRQSRLDNSREAVMLELSTVDLLIIDDFALEPMTRDESRDVYQDSWSRGVQHSRQRADAGELHAELLGLRSGQKGRSAGGLLGSVGALGQARPTYRQSEGLSQRLWDGRSSLPPHPLELLRHPGAQRDLQLEPELVPAMSCKRARAALGGDPLSYVSRGRPRGSARADLRKTEQTPRALPDDQDLSRGSRRCSSS